MTPPEERRSAALERAISEDRFASYLSAASQDRGLARRLYVWDRNVSTAILADIAVVEVGMRNAMHRVLTREYGPRWYESIDLDDRSERQLTRAWEQANKSMALDLQHPATPGRLVAECSFGFWVNLLDAGAYAGKPPRRREVSYEDLWRTCLHSAFPGGRLEAHSEDTQFTRSWAHSLARTVNTLRNRVAHHEPLLNGFPLPGQRDPRTGHRRRKFATDGFNNYLKLTRLIDRDLAEWLAHDSDVRTLLDQRPQ